MTLQKAAVEQDEPIEMVEASCSVPNEWVSATAERTVALLAFEDATSAPMADLLDISQRQKTASELNSAILASQSLARTSHQRHPDAATAASFRI